jgi:hypothetical protein
MTAPLLLLPAQAAEENASQSPQVSNVLQYLEGASAKLEDKDYDARMAARWDLATIRGTLAENLVARLRNLSNRPDKSYGSPLHLTIQTIGEWRIAHAASTLTNIIDYELDKSTIPEGKMISLRSHFPSALALVEIGGPNVRQAILQRLRTEDNEKATRICVWTLLNAYGEDVATFILEKEETNAKDDAVKKRMKAAKELVAEGEHLIFFDEQAKPNSNPPSGGEPATPPTEGTTPPAEGGTNPPVSGETP